MLKWAVQNSRPSYLPEQYDEDEDEDFCETPIKLQQECCYLMKRNYPNLKRKSLTFRRGSYGGADKENLCLTQLTSTPLPRVSSSAAMEHDLKRVHSLKDLSNIMPDRTIQSTNTSTSTLVHTTPVLQLPSHYASTLPTFDAEYSPCGLIPGTLLALRGMGIPDNYFDKPRYLHDNTPPAPTPPPSAPLNESTTNILEEKPLNVCQEPATVTATATVADNGFNAVAAISEQSTLSSTKMGDVTLERMIDAILASTRKEPTRRRKQRRYAYTRHQCPLSMQRRHQTPEVVNVVATSPSPTYRPAYDPASDLSEYWRPDDSATTTEFAPLPSYGYQEREICASSPFNQDQANQQLHRQRGVRRKRQIARRISTSVRQSAQKLFGVTSGSRSVGITQPRNISPDSGHNSTSDYDDK